jgi:hypothetical protein
MKQIDVKRAAVKLVESLMIESPAGEDKNVLTKLQSEIYNAVVVRGVSLMDVCYALNGEPTFREMLDDAGLEDPEDAVELAAAIRALTGQSK